MGDEVVYQNELPSFHLSGDDIIELEEIMENNSSNGTLSLVFSKDGFKHKFSSAKEYIDQHTVPDKTTSFRFVYKCEEGTISINTNRISNAKIRIEGKSKWVREKQYDIDKFLDRKKNVVRTHISKLVVGIYGVQWISLMALNLATESNGDVQYSFVEAIFGIFLIILTFAWPILVFGGIDHIYPKYLLKKDESIHYRPRLQKAIKNIVLLIGIIGGSITIVNYIS